MSFLKIYIAQSKETDSPLKSRDSRRWGLKKERNTPFLVPSESSCCNHHPCQNKQPCNTYLHHPISGTGTMLGGWMLSLNPAGSFGDTHFIQAAKGGRFSDSTHWVNPFFLSLPPVWNHTPTPTAVLCREWSKISWVDFMSHSFPLLSRARLAAIFKSKATGKQRFGALCSDRNRHCSYFYPADYTQCVSKLQPAAIKISQRESRRRCEQWTAMKTLCSLSASEAAWSRSSPFEAHHTKASQEGYEVVCHAFYVLGLVFFPLRFCTVA